MSSTFGGRLLLVSALSVLAGCDGGGTKDTTSVRPRPANVVLGTVQSREQHPVIDGRDLTKLVSGNTAFALDLFALAAADKPGANVALGTYSISQAMAMLYAGARGVTASELASALHFDVDPARFHQTFNGLLFIGRATDPRAAP